VLHRGIPLSVCVYLYKRQEQLIYLPVEKKLHCARLPEISNHFSTIFHEVQTEAISEFHSKQYRSKEVPKCTFVQALKKNRLPKSWACAGDPFLL